MHKVIPTSPARIMFYTAGIFLLLFGCTVKGAHRQIRPDEPRQGQKIRIAVRFADNMGYGLLDRSYKNKNTMEMLFPDGAIAELNKENKILQITRVFKINIPRANQMPLDFNKPITRSELIGLENKEQKLFKEHIQKTEKKFYKRSLRSREHDQIPNLLNVFSIEFLSKSTASEICSELRSQKNVIYASPIELAELHYYPDDPYYRSSGSWGQSYDDLYALKADKLNCEPAWDLAEGDGAIAAVIDTGVDLAHEDIANNLWVNTDEIPNNGLDDDENGYIDDVYGYDFSDKDSDPCDYDGHGSHCAGIIAASGNNNTGIIGVAPRAKIMALKGFPNSYDDVLAEAIRYAADNGADVLSNSWGPTSRKSSNPILEDAINYAYGLGCVIVFSAGNKQDDVQYYSPANYSKTIAIAATDCNDKKASFSNYGNLIAVSAPGVDILSLRGESTDMYLGSSGYTPGQRFVPPFDPLARYYRASGTSMAGPYVAGLAALLTTQFPTYSNAMIAGQIIGSADNIDAANPNYSGLLGTGRINVYRALTIEPAPCLKFYSCAINDNLPGNNPNGSLEPGETVDLIVSLKNVWADIYNTAVTLSTPDPCVTITQANSSYGFIGCGQICDNSANPFRIVLSSGAKTGHVISFVLNVTGDGYSRSIPFECKSSIGNLPGWPVASSERYVGNAPIVFDIDRDGKDEIFVALNSTLNILNDNGLNSPNWPVTVPENFFVPICAIGNIDNDPEPEVIGLVEKEWGPTQAYIYAWDFDSGQLVQGFPYNLGQNDNCSLALGNLDSNGDDLEILVAGLYGYYDAKVYVIQGDGSNVAGWPAALRVAADHSGIAVGNIDNQPGNEIVVSAGFSVPEYIPCPIYVFRSNGTMMPGWPKQTDGCLSNPVLVNLDNTEDLEILVGSVTEAHTGKLYAWKYNGSNVPGWPVNYNTADVSVGDINGDGDIEIVSGCRSTGKLRVFDKHGTLLWEKSSQVSSGFSFADINDDGKDDIIFAAFFYLSAYDYLGNPVSGFPIRLTDATDVTYAQPAICDLDGNGDIEIITYDDMKPRSINAFDLKSPMPERNQWPMYCRDQQLTNRYPLVYPGDISPDWNVNMKDIQKLVSYWLDSDCNRAERNWCYGTDIDKSGSVDLIDFQLIGRDWMRGE